MAGQPARGEAKTERLEARVPPSIKETLARAAALQGQSLSDFVLAASTEAARRVIRESELLDLSQRDQIRFAEDLVSPPVATTKLRDAARRFRETNG